MRIYESLISASSDYISLRGADSIRLFLGERLLWTRESNDPQTRLLGLGNNGTLLVYKEDAVHLYHQDGHCEAVLDDDETIQLNRVSLDTQGRTLCVESELKENPIEKKKSSFFFKSREVQEPIRYHKIFLYEPHVDDRKEIWDYERDTQIDANLQWEISKDCALLAIAETSWQEKPTRSMVTRLYLINLREDRTLFQITLSHVKVRKLYMNLKGMILVDLLDESHRQFMVISQSGEKFFINPPSRELKVLHFGNEMVVFEMFPERIILFKDYKDNLVYILDEKVLEILGVEYPILFRTNDDFIITYFDGERSVLRRYNFPWKGNKMDFLYHK